MNTIVQLQTQVAQKHISNKFQVTEKIEFQQTLINAGFSQKKHLQHNSHTFRANGDTFQIYGIEFPYSVTVNMNGDDVDITHVIKKYLKKGESAIIESVYNRYPRTLSYAISIITNETITHVNSKSILEMVKSQMNL